MMATPSARPNSVPVSEIADAVPARSGGAALTIMSVPSVTTGETPTEKMTDPATRSPSPEVAATWVSSAKPAAATTRAPLIANAGRIRRTNSGASIDPRIDPPVAGNSHTASPAHSRRPARGAVIGIE